MYVLYLTNFGVNLKKLKRFLAYTVRVPPRIPRIPITKKLI